MQAIAAIYARVSSDEQADRDNSIPAQLRLMKEFCERKGIKVYKEYVDEAISGQKENRESFQQMLEDAGKKLFSVIVVHKFNRFARKVELSRKIKNQLRKTGVKVISVTQHIDESPMGFFQEGLIELLDEYYIHELSDEVKKGMSERALKGKHMGQMPYGYYVKHGEVFINEEQAAVIRKVFELYNSGWGHLKIVRWLIENRIPTYDGTVGAWQTFQVKQMLKNPKYIGKMIWNKQLYDSTIPPIIDEDTFNTVQNQTSKKKMAYTYRGNQYNNFLLLGLLRCGSCGSSFRIKVNNAGRASQRYCYLCHAAALYRYGCTFTKLFRHDLLEKEVESYIHGIVTGEIREFKVKDTKASSDLTELRYQKVCKELQRAKEAYYAEVLSLDEYRQDKKRLEDEKKALELQMETDKSDYTQANRERAIAKIREIWDAYHSTDSIADKKKLLMSFIDSIAVHPDGVVEVNIYI